MSYYDHIWRPWRVRGGATEIASSLTWSYPQQWQRAAIKHDAPSRVLLDVDLFAPDAAVLDSERSRVWQTIDDTTNLTWLLFTRLPEDVRRTIAIPANGRDPADPLYMLRENMWLGVDVSTQQEADELIHALLRCRELCGRLIVRVTVTERIDLLAIGGPSHGVVASALHSEYESGHRALRGAPIDWLIIQGDIGRNARPCNVTHVRELVGQAGRAGVPCWVERLGSVVHATEGIDPLDQFPGEPKFRGVDRTTIAVALRDPHGADPAEWPEDLRVREVPT